MEEYEYISPSQCVCKKKDDPYIYLRVGNEWYCYDPNQQPLGGGAMGTVYLGYRVRNAAKVAVKRVKDYYANQPQIRDRARQEASLSFRHPNLIEILGYCEWDAKTGPLFILSNFVQGSPLREFVQNMPEGENRCEQIVNMFGSVLDALDYIHSNGIVHRDIKPSNIMVEDGSNVRVIDLGIARMNGGNKFSSLGFIGTPQYAAPEQILRGDTAADGSVKDVTVATDIYAAGITLYELLHGSNPFSAGADEEVLAKQIKEDLPMSTRIPAPIMKVIHKATKKDQSKRYQSALEFKEDLQKALEDKNNPSATRSVSEWIDAHAYALIGATFVVIIAILALIYFI